MIFASFLARRESNGGRPNLLQTNLHFHGETSF